MYVCTHTRIYIYIYIYIYMICAPSSGVAIRLLGRKAELWLSPFLRCCKLMFWIISGEHPVILQ